MNSYDITLRATSDEQPPPPPHRNQLHELAERTPNTPMNRSVRCATEDPVCRAGRIHLEAEFAKEASLQ